MHNNQQTFDKVTRHLLTQNKKSTGWVLTPGGEDMDGCRYRSDDGLSCAAGCLIPDELYRRHFEGQTVLSNELVVLLELLGHAPEFVRELQKIHDCFSVKDWPDLLRDVARRYRLAAAIVDEMTKGPCAG